MSNYEFWDELGKIFNAVMAYQEKTIEFNKRFINPWVRLGNVFDKQDRNQDAVSAYEQAIELDASNPQNWYELGNLHFKMEHYEEAVDAYKTAIELDPVFGWSYNNLALTLVTQGRYVEAIPLYRKSIELLEQDNDKAIAWNRLGNLYRKLNEYDLAVEAFQRADDLDQDNTGVHDNLDDVSGRSSVVPTRKPEDSDQAATLSVSPIELILADHRMHTGTKNVGIPLTAADSASVENAPLPETAAQATHDISNSQAAPVVMPGTPEHITNNSAEDPGPTTQATAGSESANTSQESGGAVDLDVHTEETISVVVPGTIETYTDTLNVQDTSSDADVATLPGENNALASSGASISDAESFNPYEADLEEPEAVEAFPSEGEVSYFDEVFKAGEKIAIDVYEGKNDAAIDQQAAYEQFLKDSQQPVDLLGEEVLENTAGSENPAATQEPIPNIDASSEPQTEVDIQNAEAWNEMGNSYFNTGTYDDAITAYTKAIELDHWFAWPYSNLALAYVQKGRFVEAILLYQRSIELFTSEKDKAISWNRLGNVYRRLNDYENAISSYQRADELDPDNITLSQQSRFSLLGSYSMDQKPSYVS